ncbi:MAG: hypothetical protein M1821_000673 [Bathelium mastoideum]|nr:MAG: hypothetical protein M1821_000673 [Bathelium mastoideum]
MAQNNPSFVLRKTGELAFEDRQVPEIQDPYDVIVNIKYTGICGSDIHYWTHGAIGPFVLTSPITLGHESAGIVTQVGPDVTTLKSGDRVALEPGIPCRRCIRCKEGKYNVCPDTIFAATPPFHGTLARFYSIPEDFCFKLPEHVSLEEGALVEPTAVAVHMTKQADIKPGQNVVIFGAGPVGLLCCALARFYGARKVVTVDINEERVRFAGEFAATHVYKAQDESAERSAARLIEETELGTGADTVIDATGAEACIQTGVHVLRTGGTYVQGGMGKTNINFPIGAVCTKELILKGSLRYGSGDYRLAVDLISERRFRFKDLITKIVPFSEAELAFEAVKEGKGIKTLIQGPPSE